ncbi:hypothetical protein [Sphingobium sp. YG1]|uniref:hypothetical protein n=1 Tax=Sphingobium sp. YG1 TaxID=2082188 RepID=UPI000E74D2B2|nr:hypothetical protein [Sphingobium sp. YG1]
MKAASKVGSIEIVGDAIIIKRHRIFGSEEQVRVLKMEHLTGIEFRKSGVEAGYLKVIHSGSTSSSSSLAVKAYDQDTVRFDIRDEADFASVRAILMERITGIPFKEDPTPAIDPGEILKLLAGLIFAILVIMVWVNILF